MQYNDWAAVTTFSDTQAPLCLHIVIRGSWRPDICRLAIILRIKASRPAKILSLRGKTNRAPHCLHPVSFMSRRPIYRARGATKRGTRICGGRFVDDLRKLKRTSPSVMDADLKSLSRTEVVCSGLMVPGGSHIRILP